MLFLSIVFCFDDPFGFSVDSTASDPFSQIQGVSSPTNVISTTISTLVAHNSFPQTYHTRPVSLSGLRAYPSLPQQLHLLTLQSTRRLATFPQTRPSRSPLLRKCTPTTHRQRQRNRRTDIYHLLFTTPLRFDGSSHADIISLLPGRSRHGHVPRRLPAISQSDRCRGVQSGETSISCRSALKPNEMVGLIYFSPCDRERHTHKQMRWSGACF